MGNRVINLFSVLLRVRALGAGKLGGLNEALVTPMFLLSSPFGLKRQAEKLPGRPQPLIRCAHMLLLLLLLSCFSCV